MSSLNHQKRVQRVAGLLKAHPDFPKKGIFFQDIFPIMRNPEVFRDLISLFVEHIEANCKGAEVIVGLDARGFIFGPMVAEKLNIAFAPIRKQGKLPGECESASYTKEYGEDVFEIQKESIKAGQKVVIVDDVLATGGTMKAAVDLMKKVNAEVLDCMVVIEAADLKGRDVVGQNIFSLISM